jgi:hypothetical protein
MAEELQSQVIDVPLGVMNQTPPDTATPLGRIKQLIDGQISHFTTAYSGATAQIPSSIRVDPRDAFVSFTTAARSIIDGSVSSPPWTNPELISGFGSQLVSIADAQPRILNGSSWSTYPNTRVHTQALSQDVLHTSQHTIQVPDSNVLNGVRCCAWTETTPTSAGPLTTSMVGFRSTSGAWLVQPTVLFASTSTSTVTMAKVVADPVSQKFFVFFNNASSQVIVNVYDVTGALLGQSGIALTALASGGLWDVITAVSPSPNAGTVLFAQPLTTVSGVSFTSVGFAAPSTVTTHFEVDNTVQCGGPVAFVTNDTGNGLAYLATLSTDDAFFAYEVQALAQVHEFGPFLDFENDINNLDSIAGAAIQGADGIDVVLSIGLLPNSTTPADSGPPVDPAFRYLTSIQCDRSNVVTPIRKTQSLAQVSRAYAVDSEYFVDAYYQSGSGSQTPTSSAVTLTAGDYFVGAASQAISVQPGDTVTGSPVSATNVTTAGNTVNVTPGETARNVAAGDKAVLSPASGLASLGIPDGTMLLTWTLANLGFGGAQWAGSRLTLTGASGLNTTFDIVTGAGSTISTPAADIFGNAITSSTTFTASGTFAVQSMTAYYLDDLSAIISADALAQFYTNAGSTMVVTDSTTAGNAGTFAIKRISTSLGSSPSVAGNPTYLFGLRTGTFVWVQTTTQSTHGDIFTAVLTPNDSNSWFFSSQRFDSTYVGADLVVSADPAVALNVGTYPITAAGVPLSPIGVTTGDATAILPQVFAFPFPTISVNLTTQVAYTFRLQSVTPDYTYQNAIVSVQDAVHTANNGTYQIVQINADGTFIATPTDGSTDQLNEQLDPALGQVITIFFDPDVVPAFQSTWFRVPLTGTQPVVGRWDYGLAYADWRAEATSKPNLYPMALASVSNTGAGQQIVLPFRSQNATSNVIQVTAAGEVDIGDNTYDSTVGLKLFTFSDPGQAYANDSELAIPGPMATSLTKSGFFESGINLAPEAPFLVSQSVASSGQLALTKGGVYFYVVVFEYTDESGNRIFSQPSPALQVSMSGDNNVATLGGRLIFPLDSTGKPVANTYGPTTRPVTISIYRTLFVNGEVTAQQHYKSTNDLNVNGLAPISSLNPSGFSFPNSLTWQYVDQNAETEIRASEILYTDKSYLPRYPRPPFRQGINFRNRDFVVGFDDAVWMSAEKTEGDAVWFHPTMRFPFSALDKPLAVAALEDDLIVLCQKSCWAIPLSGVNLPDGTATGGGGSLPTPIELRFPNGSKRGFAKTIRSGVVYDSTAGGLWVITPGANGNEWLSHQVQDVEGEVAGLALDQNQRLGVAQTGTQQMLVFDGVPGAWYMWKCPTTPALLATFNGQIVYQDAATVNAVTPGTFVDSINGTQTGYAPDITIAPFGFGGVRSVKRVWKFQASLTYLGPHRLNTTLSYPQDTFPSLTYKPFIPDPSKPYVYEFRPRFQEAALYGVRIWADFVGLSPGPSYSLEMISVEVGVDQRRARKQPASGRASS